MNTVNKAFPLEQNIYCLQNITMKRITQTIETMFSYKRCSRDDERRV